MRPDENIGYKKNLPNNDAIGYGKAFSSNYELAEARIINVQNAILEQLSQWHSSDSESSKGSGGSNIYAAWRDIQWVILPLSTDISASLDEKDKSYLEEGGERGLL